MTPSINPPVGDERERYEAELRRIYTTAGPALIRRRDMAGSERLGEYVAAHIEFGWKVWQARAALAQQAPAAEPVAWRVRHRSESGMIGHYPWSYIERIRGTRRPEYEYEPLFAHPPADVPEGCTPADAEMLRRANHELAEENHRLRQATSGKWSHLYDTVNAVVARMGATGEISIRDPEVELMMDALHDLDGGQFVPGLAKGDKP